jgi:hypothetical protein
VRTRACERAGKIGVELPLTPQQAKQPHPLVRPLVLRARQGEQVRIKLHNRIPGRAVGLHLVAGGYNVVDAEGSDVGQGVNRSSLAAPNCTYTYDWSCDHQGVFPFHDGGNYSGDEHGTNVHGLFGALVVEPPGTTWRDPTTSIASHGANGSRHFTQVDGLYLDMLPTGVKPNQRCDSDTSLDRYEWPTPVECFSETRVYREFVIFFHDKPEFVPVHNNLEPNPCSNSRASHSTAHGGGGHDNMPIMPISYRAEPMINRERALWRLLRTGHLLERPVLNEE